jgi:hypothetical protein
MSILTKSGGVSKLTKRSSEGQERTLNDSPGGGLGLPSIEEQIQTEKLK